MPDISRNISGYNFYCSDMTSFELSVYNTCVAALSHGTLCFEARFPERTDFSVTLKKLLNALHYGCPELFFIDDKIKYNPENDTPTIEVRPKYPPNDFDRMYKELDEKIDKLVRKLTNIPDAVGKIFALNEYFCNNIKYVHGLSSETGDAYSALVLGVARCEGIAKAAKIILDRLGYKSIILYGTACVNGVEESHAWNIAEVDGKWYQFDFTWCISRTFNELKIPCVEYLFLTDAEMSIEHLSDVKGYPASTDTSKTFWELNKSVVRYSSDFEHLKPIAHGDNYYVVVKLQQKPSFSDVKDQVPLWYKYEMSGAVISKNYAYIYNEQIGILTLYLLNE